MTTVTPSDQAGAASAKRPATIPTQRSGQTLRLLVLGTGEDAAAFRARAAEAGVELAQRFSVRVTHVVAGQGVGGDDARVVRARGAGLPVLGLLEAARLVEETMSGGGRAGVEGGVGDGVGERVPEDVEAGGTVDAGAGTSGDVGGEASADSRVDWGADQDRAGTAAGVGVDSGDRDDVVPLIRPRAEGVSEPGDGGPSDVFSGSAFEAMLQFPPLPTSEFDGGSEGAEGDEGAEEIGKRSEAADADADMHTDVDVDVRAGAGADVDVRSGAEVDVDAVAEVVATGDVVSDEVPSVLMDVASAACACAETGVGAAEDEAEAAGDELGAVGERDDVVELLNAAADEEGEPTAAGRAASIAWTLVPLVSLGLLTPVAIGYAAYRLRSRSLAAAAGCYTVAIVAAFAVSAALPVQTRAQSTIGDLMTTCLAASWLGGTAHAFMLRRRVFRLFE